jgi:spore maturation protein CgeB
MKILCSGYHNPHYLTVTEYIEKAIRGLGHQLEVFDDRRHLLPGRLRRRIKLLDSLSHRWINWKFIKSVRNGKSDIALVTGGHRISAQSLKALKALPVRLVLWTTDAPIHFEPILSAAPFYDYIFCQGTEAVELLNSAGNHNPRWLPMACDPAIHKKIYLTAEEHERYANDIIFVGSYHPNRERTLKRLAVFDIAIWGPGWGEHCRDSSLKSRIKGAHTSTDTWIKLYNACKIALSIHYKHPQNNIKVYQASPRIFEAMACGAFVLTDYQRDVFKLFKDGEHVVGYDVYKDLNSKIEFYLNHPRERKKIAERGQKAAINSHQYVHRIEKLLSITNAH